MTEGTYYGSYGTSVPGNANIMIIAPFNDLFPPLHPLKTALDLS